jgi:hypothetical protein
MSSLGQRRSTITSAAHTCAASTATKSTANVSQMMVMNMALSRIAERGERVKQRGVSQQTRAMGRPA